MPKRLVFFALVVAGCSKAGSGGADAARADSAVPVAANQAQVVAFRVPTRGGSLGIYSLPGLEAEAGGAGSRLTGVRTAIGMDLPGRRLLFLDSNGAINSFDLVSLRQKIVAPRRATATIAADGSLLAVDSNGAVTESQPWGTRNWPDSLGRGVWKVFAAPGPRLIAIRRTRAGDSLAIAMRENGVGQSVAVPVAVDQAASRDGDAYAFATDSGVVVFEDREMARPWFVKLSGGPRAVMFSPSGHRLYVALKDKSELAVIDRFGRRERPSISLPGPAVEMRADPWGRAIMIRGEGQGDAADVYVVGVAGNSVSGTMRSTWAADLPAAAERGVILSREGGAIVARDLRSLDSLGAVAGAAGDLWFAGRWVPTSATAGVRAAAAAQAEGRRGEQTVTPGRTQPAPEQRPTITADKPRPAPDGTGAASFWIQLTSTRVESAARALVNELRSPYTQVVPPKTEDDTWRVMVGPFWTREAADSAGRSIGRPYWVVDRSRELRPRQ